MIIKVKVHYGSGLLNFFPPWIKGVTIGNHIFFSNDKENVSSTLLNHELIHVCQYADKGITGFLWEYLWKQRGASYREKAAELEAYANEKDPDYISTRWPDYQLELVV